MTRELEPSISSSSNYDPIKHWGFESSPQTPLFSPPPQLPLTITQIVEKHLQTGTQNFLPQYTAPIRYLSNQENYEDQPHNVMSPSDIEAVIKAEEIGLDNLIANPQLLLPTEAQAKGSIRGDAGHFLVSMLNQAVTNSRGNKSFLPFFANHASLKPHEHEYIDIAMAQVLGNKTRVNLKEVPELVNDSWKILRNYFTFLKLVPNSKYIPLKNGGVFSSNWVQDIWNSNQQQRFEEQIIDLYRTEIQNYLSADLFDPTKDGISLPFETSPRWISSIEQLIITHIFFGPHKIQWKGQIDHLLRNQNKSKKAFVLLDLKFGSPLELFELPNRIQALIYSHAVTVNQFGKRDIPFVRPTNVMFLYKVIDVKNGGTNYIDATIREDDYLDIMDKVHYYTQIWHNNYKEFWQLRKLQREALIKPHLPSGEELKRAAV